jgi:phosphoglycolate phosphatase
MRLFVFDLDGTLVDSRRDLAESANELLEQYGAAPLSIETVTDMVGEGARVLVERVLAARAVASPVAHALDRFLEIYERRLHVHTRLYPGVGETLDALEGRAALAVLTNKPGRHTGLLLDALGLGHRFTRVIGGDSAFPRKPDPAALLHLVEATGASVDTTVMVGDSMVDVETARQAGCLMCVAAYGFGRFPEPGAFEPGTLVVRDSAFLPQVCGSLLSTSRSI